MGPAQGWSSLGRSHMYYVYIIYSQSRSTKYIGFTTDLKLRIKDHKSGKSRYTKTASDWLIVYYEAFVNKTDAIREERFLKSGKGKERVRFLLQETLQEMVGCRSGRTGSLGKRVGA